MHYLLTLENFKIYIKTLTKIAYVGEWKTVMIPRCTV
jgi:hypothetical protein